MTRSLDDLSTTKVNGKALTHYESYQAIASKFTQFKSSEIDLFIKQFHALDKDGNGLIDSTDMVRVCREIGESTNSLNIQSKIGEVDLNKNNVIEFDEFLQVS